MSTIADAPRTLPGYVVDALTRDAAYSDVLETVNELRWPLSTITYGRMRHDPQLKAVLNAYTLPLRSAMFHVDPAGCRDEVVQLVADDLGVPILGLDDKPGPARRRGVDFDELLRMALLHLVWGHMVFVQRYDIIAGRARLAELSPRMPTSIQWIRTTTDGQIDYIEQILSAEKIPASQLVWFAHEREASAWQGRSMMRAAYGAWLLKHEMWRVLGTSSRRFGTGVPTVSAPPGAPPNAVDTAERLASAITVSNQAGIGLPDGYKVALQGVTGSVPDTLGFVRYLDSQMAQSVLAGVLNLGESRYGSRALGETMVGLLQVSWQSVAKELTSPLTGLSVQMVDYNWGEDEPAPRISCGEIAKPEATATAIAELVTAGALKPDESIDSFLRERFELPDLVGPFKDPVPTPPPAPPGGTPTSAPEAPQPDARAPAGAT